MSTTVGLAGTWGSKFAVPPKTQSDWGTTYNKMMNDDQLNSEKRKDQQNSYCRFKTREGIRQPVMSFRLSLSEEMTALEKREANMIIKSIPPRSSRALCRDKSNTTLRRIHSSDTAPAVGRSGPRAKPERTRRAIPGERFTMDPDPQKNSFVNRSWMYKDDPAHLYMRDGIPEAYMPNDVSLPIGEGGNKIEVGWKHHAKSTITGGPLTKSGSRRAGVFTDDFDMYGNSNAIHDNQEDE